MAAPAKTPEQILDEIYDAAYHDGEWYDPDNELGSDFIGNVLIALNHWREPPEEGSTERGPRTGPGEGGGNNAISPDPERPNWEPFYGNNHLRIGIHEGHWGGSVSFTEHMGQPLSPSLWKDLVGRLHVSGICIYKPDDMRWLCGWPDGHVTIGLDENDKVQEIKFSPYYPKQP